MPFTFSRRAWLEQSACGFGALALAGLGATAATTPDPLAPKTPHHPPRIRRVIFLFMQGGVSHVDSFDHKPRLTQHDGQQMPFDDARVLANTGNRGTQHRVMKPLWEFAPRGQSGKMVSSLFPAIHPHVDDLCFLHGMETEGVAHGPATLFLHCGSTNFIRPSMGSWVLYGLGSANQNLPGFVTIAPTSGNGGSRNYGSAFLPAVFQGTPLGQAGGRVQEMVIRNLNRRGQLPQGLLDELHAAQLERTPGDTEREAIVRSYELAARMQLNAPDVLDLSQETVETLKLYGIGAGPTDTFGRQCLMARRLAEANVRFIQVTYGDGSANPAWDQHNHLIKHADHARNVDQPIAGLLTDLKRRGLLEDTLVWWGGEFGRTPYAQNNGTGRDHNPGGFTVWLAGGGVKTAFSHGATDDFGAKAVQGKVHMHDLHATILHLLGLDHERLTFRYAGRDFRLTDVHGHVVQDILA